MADIIYLGVNGAAGRIGKLNTWQLFQLDGGDIAKNYPGKRVVVGAINDLASTDAIVRSYQKRDQTHGALGWDIQKIDNSTIRINGNPVKVYHEPDPSKIPWESDVYMVIECTGKATDGKIAGGHRRESGPKKVAISAPGTNVDANLAMYINHLTYDPARHNVVSNASCTTKALSVALKALKNGGAKIHSVLMDTCHAATNTQRALQFMDEYGLIDEIQTAKTGAAIATSGLIPELKGLMDGYAIRVPTRDGSIVNSFIVASAPDTPFGLNIHDRNSINAFLIAEAGREETLGRLEVITEQQETEVGSTDIIGRTASGIIVASKTFSHPLPFKVIGREGDIVSHLGLCVAYDNELGPSRDIAELARYMARK